jgi:hypothetical protein
MTKRLLVLLGVCLAVTGWATQAFAYKIKTGAWRGGSYNNSQGGFNHCVVSAKYKRGDRLLFSINRKYIFSIGIADPRWNLQKGSRYPVTLQVDRHQSFDRTALAVSNQQLVITINDRVTFFRLVKRGRTLRIKANGLNRGYDLRGTTRALNATLRCVKSKLRYANVDAPRAVDQPRVDQPRVDQPRVEKPRVDQPRTVGRPVDDDPFGTDESEARTGPRVAGLPPKTATRKKYGLTTQQALIKTINLLSDAGIGGYKLLDKNPFKKQGYQVAWRYSRGKRGALKTYNTKAKGFVESLSSNLVGGDAKACKGKFVSAFQKTDSSAKWAGRRILTVCSNASNGGDFTIRYSIGIQPNGIGVIVATVLTGTAIADDNNESEQIDLAIYKSATFRSIGK